MILASFTNRHGAEHMLASLGRDFREKARKGRVAVLVVSGNKDGSLEVTRSRVLTASGWVAMLMRVSLSVLVGFSGLVSTLKLGRAGGRAVRTREGHVGSDDERAHAILAEAGPNAALALVTCKEDRIRQAVVAEATERAINEWDGSRSEFLADPDPGPKHDWVRKSLGEHTSNAGS